MQVVVLQLKYKGNNGILPSFYGEVNMYFGKSQNGIWDYQNGMEGIIFLYGGTR